MNDLVAQSLKLTLTDNEDVEAVALKLLSGPKTIKELDTSECAISLSLLIKHGLVKVNDKGLNTVFELDRNAILLRLSFPRLV